MQSSSELREELATLEVDIMHLERHILSLYRTAFEGHLSTLSDTPAPHLQYKIGSSPKILSNQSHQNMVPSVLKDGLVHQDKMYGWVSSDIQSCAASLNLKSRRVKTPPFSNVDLVDGTDYSCMLTNIYKIVSLHYYCICRL